jgi:two-component system, LytTR family, sensor kinase
MRTPKAWRDPAIRQSLIIAVGVWIATVPLFMAPSMAAPEPADPWMWMAAGLVALAGVALAPALLWLVQAADRQPARGPRLILIILGVVLVALIHSVIDTAVHQLLMMKFAPESRGTLFVDKEGGVTPAPLHFYVLANFITLLWIHAGVTALGALSRFNIRVRRDEVATAEARAAADQAKLATLRLQLSPHFLFNTLNAISSLVMIGRHVDAERMLTRLSDFLRASLGPGETGLVSLASELSAVSAYLDIESLRFEGQIRSEVVSDEGLHDAMAPTFLLQPLAEQAVAHAVSPPRRQVVIHVEAAGDADAGMTVTIRTQTVDDEPSAEPPPLELAAVRSRLAALYGERASLEATSDGSGFTAAARLPFDLDGRRRP